MLDSANTARYNKTHIHIFTNSYNKMPSKHRYLKGIKRRREQGMKETKSSAMLYPFELMRMAKDIWAKL